MNLKVLSTFALASSGLLASAHPHERPNCTVGEDTQACALPDGGEGMFLCHPHPPFHHHDGEEHWHHDHHHHHDHHDGGGILGVFHRAVDRITGHGHHHSFSHDDEHDGHSSHGKPCHKDKKGPRQLHLRSGSGSSSSSSSSSSSRSGFHRHHGHGHGHEHDSHDHHHHDWMGMGTGRHGGGMMGPHGGHGGGPPGLLSSTHCVPIDGPPMMDHPHPWHHHHDDQDDHDHHDHDHPHDPPTCGCCGDVCPIKLDSCGCACDLTDWEGNAVEDGKGAGVWVTVTLMRDENITIKKCVPAGSYVDANRVQCITECSADLVAEEKKAMKLLDEKFGDEGELEEKESRD